MNSSPLKPDKNRIWRKIETLSSFRDPDREGWTRRSFTPRYREGREYIKERMKQAGLSVSQDAAANLIGRRAGRNRRLPPIWIGSHTNQVCIDPTIVNLIKKACTLATDHCQEIASGAGHDINQLACFAPVGMIFIPSRKGRSHCPEEYTDTRSIALGTEALLNTVLEIDKRTPVSDAVK